MTNRYYGTDFEVQGRKYGGVNLLGFLSPWRHRILKVANKTASSQWVKKWSFEGDGYKEWY